MKSLVSVVVLAILLIGLILLGLSDTDISVADTRDPENGVTSGLNTTDNSDSASDSILITMHTSPMNSPASGFGGREMENWHHADLL